MQQWMDWHDSKQSRQGEARDLHKKRNCGLCIQHIFSSSVQHDVECKYTRKRLILSVETLWRVKDEWQRVYEKKNILKPPSAATSKTKKEAMGQAIMHDFQCSWPQKAECPDWSDCSSITEDDRSVITNAPFKFSLVTTAASFILTAGSTLTTAGMPLKVSLFRTIGLNGISVTLLLSGLRSDFSFLFSVLGGRAYASSEESTSKRWWKMQKVNLTQKANNLRKRATVRMFL